MSDEPEQLFTVNLEDELSNQFSSGDVRNLLTFLDMARRGGVSGNISKWPQFKRACALAFHAMVLFTAERERIKEVLAPFARVASVIDSSSKMVTDDTAIWSRCANDDSGFSLTMRDVRNAQCLLDDLNGRD